jgi:hypothetical protein
LSNRGPAIPGQPPPTPVELSRRSLVRDDEINSIFKQPILRPSLRGANGSRECAPDDRLHEAIHRAAQRKNGLLRRFAPRNDVKIRCSPPLQPPYPAHAGYPVRRGPSVLSLMPVEYCIARSSRAMTTGGVACLHRIAFFRFDFQTAERVCARDPAARGARGFARTVRP